MDSTSALSNPLLVTTAGGLMVTNPALFTHTMLSAAPTLLLGNSPVLGYGSASIIVLRPSYGVKGFHLLRGIVYFRDRNINYLKKKDLVKVDFRATSDTFEST